MKHASLRSTVGLALVLTVMATAVSMAQQYRFMFRGDNMMPGERIHTWDHELGIQGEGEDTGRNAVPRRRRVVGSSSEAPEATTQISEWAGKEVYAIAAGTIVGCWRNAEENPFPPAHHEKMVTGTEKVNGVDINVGLIPGGGNMLFVDLPDGTQMLYAHMIPGTIPPSLCSNNDKFLPSAMTIPEGDKFVMLDASKQVSVSKGQFLGDAGNSGSSSAPHLHIHAEKAGKPALMRFDQGMSKGFIVANAPIQGGWTSFASNEIPDGRVLIRPPRANPYRMADFEAYPTGNTLMYVGIFKPGNHAATALLEADWATFLRGWQDLETQGYRMKDFDSFTRGATRMFGQARLNRARMRRSPYSREMATNLWRPGKRLRGRDIRMIDLEVVRIRERPKMGRDLRAGHIRSDGAVQG